MTQYYLYMEVTSGHFGQGHFHKYESPINLEFINVKRLGNKYLHFFAHI